MEETKGCDLYCQPDRRDPLKELPYFLDDLRIKVYFSQNKELKVKHRSIAIAFANQVKKDPDILFKSKNYEETLPTFVMKMINIFTKKCLLNILDNLDLISFC